MSDAADRAGWVQKLVNDNREGRDFDLPWSDPPSLADAYEVQDAVFEGLADDRGQLGGYKVAITAKPMQEAMGLTEPLGGLVHSGQLRPSDDALSMADFHSPALECEVTIRVGSDVPPLPSGYDRRSIEPYVGEVLASFELVDPRGADLSEVGAAGLVADRCLSEGAVLGSGVRNWSAIDLADCPVELEWNGEVIERSVTGAAMGHPFAGLAWVANHLNDRGRRLMAGQVVLTGSAFAPKPVAAGDRVTYRIEGVGEVSVEITA